MNAFKKIGVLGGMGALSSANFYHQMIQYCQHQYGAVQDADFPAMMIYNYPLEGFDETGIVDRDLVVMQLTEALQALEQSGCEILVMVCNTVHALWEELQASVSVPLVSLITQVVEHVEDQGYQKIGLLCSETTNRLGLYASEKMDIITPSDFQQKQLNQVIEHVMAGVQNDYDAKICKDIMYQMQRLGAEAVILGCTEIPLAIDQLQTDMKIFDTIELAVQAVVDFSLKN